MTAITRLLQLASPALPVGAYSYSQGLEWAIESGDVNNSATAQHWIEDHLALVFARFEAPLYAAAFAAWSREDVAEVARLNADFISTRESAEPRAETVQVGFSYAAWCREVAPLTDAEKKLYGGYLGEKAFSGPIFSARGAGTGSLLDALKR